MGVLNRLIGRTQYVTTPEALEVLWIEHKETFVQRKELFIQRRVLREAGKYIRLLQTHFFDERDAEQNVTHAYTALFLKAHSTNILNIDHLKAPFYNEENIHQYTHAILAHLHLTLTIQARAVQKTTQNDMTEDALYETLTREISEEERIITEIDTFLTHMHEHLYALLAQKVRTYATTGNSLKEYNKIEAEIRAFNYKPGSRVYDDFSILDTLLKERTKEQRATYEENDPETPIADLDLFILSQPDFLQHVKQELDTFHRQDNSPDYIEALVRSFREAHHNKLNS